jgi:hypothetical protein
MRRLSIVSYVDSFDEGDRCITRRVSAQQIVDRAFLLAKKTGDACVGKQTVGLGDEGAHLVAQKFAGRAELQKFVAHLGDPEAFGSQHRTEEPESMQRNNLVGDGQVLVRHHGTLSPPPDLIDSRSITSLSMCNHGVGPVGAKALASALRDNPHLQQLNFFNNYLGAEGAAELCRALVTVSNLHTLNLGKNSIGPVFPEYLAQCTALTYLHMPHNQLENVSIELGNHPSLVQLELVGNDIKIPDAEELIRQKRFAQSPPQFMRQRGYKALKGVQKNKMIAMQEDGKLENWGTTKLRKYLLEIMIHMCSEERFRNVGEEDAWCPRICDVQITLADRWNKEGWEVEYVNDLLDNYTSLQALNGLQEWPSPPFGFLPTWDLTNKLKNPLYECHFVKNRLLASPSITGLVVDQNDLRGRAAQDIAQAIASFPHLSAFSARACKWDDSIMDLANAVRLCQQIHTVNGMTLDEADTEWDLKGRILNAVDVSFAVRLLIDKGPKSNLSSLDLRGNNLQHSSAVMIADCLSSLRNLTELNALCLPKPIDQSASTPNSSLPSRRASVKSESTEGMSRVTSDGNNEKKSENGYKSEDGLTLDVVLESPISVVSSPNSPEDFVFTEALDMRKKLLDGRVESQGFGPTSGSLPIELT